MYRDLNLGEIKDNSSSKNNDTMTLIYSLLSTVILVYSINILFFDHNLGVITLQAKEDLNKALKTDLSFISMVIKS